jgi:hypothetical protein
LERASRFLLVIALSGTPAADSVALVLLLQIPRFIYGQSIPLLFAAESLNANFTFKLTN